MSKGNLIKSSKSIIQVAKVLDIVFNEYLTKNTLRKIPGTCAYYIIYLIKKY